MNTVSDEVMDVFGEPWFEKTLKVLATQFGDSATLKDVHVAFQKYRPVPQKEVNGIPYSAGYHFFDAGKHIGKLLDIRQHGSHCKLMFELDDSGYFLYHNYPVTKLKVEQVVRLAQYLNRKFPVVVAQETVQNTGDKHATINFVDGLEEVLMSAAGMAP